MRILVYGSLNQDIVYDVERFGLPGETTKALHVSRFPGGKGLNQAVAAAQAGGEVFMAGTIGPDGDWLLDVLKDKGADVSLVNRTAVSTGTAIIERNTAGQNRILLDPGANHCSTEAAIRHTLDHFSPGDLVICQNETNLVDFLIKEAARRHLKILFNPAPMTPDVEKMDLNAVTFLAVNEHECAQLLHTESHDPQELCTRFHARYPETTLLLTLGDKGAVMENGTTLFVPARKVCATDTTGAGDTWIGYFADGYRRSLPWSSAMKRAAAAAALSVQKAGAASSIPSHEEVGQFMDM